MSKLKQIIRLRNEGTALQTIARAVSISRNTVKKYLRLIEVKGLNPTSLLQMEDNVLEALMDDPDPEEQERLAFLEELFPYFERELARTGVTRWVLWGEYKQQYPAGVIGNHNCRIFRNQEYKGFGNKEYKGFGNKGAEKMETRNTEICRINIIGNGTNPLYIKAYGLS